MLDPTLKYSRPLNYGVNPFGCNRENDNEVEENCLLSAF